jgi:hypothetical protein
MLFSFPARSDSKNSLVLWSRFMLKLGSRIVIFLERPQENPCTDFMIIGIMLILATFAHHLFEN